MFNIVLHLLIYSCIYWFIYSFCIYWLFNSFVCFRKYAHTLIELNAYSIQYTAVNIPPPSASGAVTRGTTSHFAAQKIPLWRCVTPGSNLPGRCHSLETERAASDWAKTSRPRQPSVSSRENSLYNKLALKSKRDPSVRGNRGNDMQGERKWFGSVSGSQGRRATMRKKARTLSPWPRTVFWPCVCELTHHVVCILTHRSECSGRGAAARSPSSASCTTSTPISSNKVRDHLMRARLNRLCWNACMTFISPSSTF